MTRRDFPTPVSGYALRNYRFSIVQPLAATNIVPNPSLERDTIGWGAAGGAAIARSSAWQRRGAYSLAVTPGAGLADGCFFGTVPMLRGTLYAMSVDILGAGGVPYAIYFANTIAQRLSPALAFIGSGKAQRPVLLWSPPASGSYRCYIAKNGHASTKGFFVDGLQVEPAPASTYLDGDQCGFMASQVAYYWNGAPHASASSRILATRAGGVEMNLANYGFTLLSVLGLGLGGYLNQFTPNSFVGGAEYDGTLAVERTFDLVGALTARSHLELQSRRSDLAQLLRPNAGILQQPLLLRAQLVDDCGDAAGEPVEIPCTFEPDGLVGQINNDFQERVDLQFKIFMPFVARRDGEEGASLSYQTSIANANDLVVRAANGQWSVLGTGFNGAVTAIAVDKNHGRVYFAGLFTTASGASVNRICYYDIAAGAFVAMDSGVNGTVRALAIAPNGDVWAGGSFTQVGAAATAAKGIARWNYASGTWSAFNPSTATFTEVSTLAIDAAGKVYAGGTFTDWAGNANSDNIVSTTDGITWSALSTGANSKVAALAIAPNGTTLYLGGVFTSPQTRIMSWNGSVFAALGSGADNNVTALAFGSDGELYAGGAFTVTPGPGAAVWTGSSWSGLGSGLNNSADALLPLQGRLYAGGKFSTAGGLTTPDKAAVWTGSAWVYLDVDLPGTPTIISALGELNGALYVGYDTTGTAVAGVVNPVTNTGSADAYPIFEFQGPGTVYQIVNYTTGDALYFNLVLNAGETATLDLRPGNLSFVSSFRGDLSGTILPGSTFGGWHLAPGANSVEAFISSVSALTALAAHWAPAYLALEDSLY